VGQEAVQAQSAPPDPAGIATGDKTNVADAAGNPFVVAEPTDKADPDYAAKRKRSTNIRIRPQKSRSR
jgi:hypothetical protein